MIKPIIKMKAFVGKCTCGGSVKMGRDKDYPYDLNPENCWCFVCGREYQVVTDNIFNWEMEQWKQKAEEENKTT